jgi:hypothetical protein
MDPNSDGLDYFDSALIAAELNELQPLNTYAVELNSQEFDSRFEADLDFGSGGDFYFAWSGDESNTMMSYIDLNWDFSQFDRDNMNRYLTSIYINQANTILADIYASPKAGQVSSLLTSADNHAAAALSAYDSMNYAGAALHAKLAYNDVLSAAAQINVKVEPQSWQADYKAKGKSDKFVDTVDYQRSKP